MMSHRKQARHGQQKSEHNDIGDFPIKGFEVEFLRDIGIPVLNHILRRWTLAVLRILSEYRGGRIKQGEDKQQPDQAPPPII